MWRPQIICFGDSITQKAFGPHGWATYISENLQRRVDVINRGYSGYNSALGVEVLEYVFDPGSMPAPSLVTVFFGANDAVLPGHEFSKQHVSVEDYGKNLKFIVNFIRSSFTPVPDICLIAPPPVGEKQRILHAFEKYGARLTESERKNDITGQYAKQCLLVASSEELCSVNLWSEFQKIPNWETSLLSDGLHLSPEGNELASKLIWEEVITRYPHLDPQSIPMDLPDWIELTNVEPDMVSEAIRDYREKFHNLQG